MTSFKEYLMHIVHLKELKLFVGIRVTIENSVLKLDQNTYINSVNYEVLSLDDKCNKPCRSIIDCLMYIMICTRPDLSFSVNIIS